MSILQLRDYVADAELRGQVRRVEYRGDARTLVIHGVTISEAGALLEALAIGTLLGVEQNPTARAQQVSSPVKPVPLVLAQPISSQSVILSALAEKAAANPLEELDRFEGADFDPPAKPDVPCALPTDAVTFDVLPTVPLIASAVRNPRGQACTRPLPTDSADDPKDPYDGEMEVSGEPSGSVVAAAPVAKAASVGSSNDVPTVGPELLGAKRLGDVISYFMDHGITDTEALVEKCAAVANEVPVLRRMANLPDRVRRTCQNLALEVEAR